MNSETHSHDEIRVRGVMSRGYGQLAKIVMLDSDLTIEAKGIYAYFVSFTGAGRNSAFPSRDKIIHDLGISKDTYYKHFRLLTEQGYITVEQQRDNKFSRNIYIIENFPEKYASVPSECSESRARALFGIKYAGDISAAGYGNVPKTVMTDVNIGIQAKALYAYLCVWTGQDLNATPSRDTVLYHMGITHPTYNKYIKQLLERNYVTRSNVLVGGRFSGVMYHLNTAISDPDISPESKISDTEISDAEISDAGFSDTEIPDAEISDAGFSDTEIPESKISDTEIQDTNNTNIHTIPNKNKTSIKNNQSITAAGSAAADPGRVDGPVDNEQILYEIAESGCLPESYLFDIVRLQAAVSVISSRGSDDLSERFEPAEAAARKQLYELFNTCLCEMLNGNGEPARVNGAAIPYSAVYKALSCVLRAGFSDSDEPYATLAEFPDHVISEYIKSSAGTKIRNHKAYLKAIIWTSLTTMFISEFTEMVHDFGSSSVKPQK